MAYGYDLEECWPPCCGGEGCPACGDGSEYQDDAPFRDPGGRSALRAGRLIHPCPTCGAPDVLTEADRMRGYQCDDCADRDEGFGP